MSIIFNSVKISAGRLTGIFLLLFMVKPGTAQTKDTSSNPIRLNQIGFYPNAIKKAIVLSGAGGLFTIQSPNKRTVFSGSLKPSVNLSFAGRTTYIADFSDFTKPGEYQLIVAGAGSSYPFKIAGNVHQKIAKGVIKAYYFMRASTPLPVKYAGKWSRAGGHPDDKVIVHPSAASEKRPADAIISSPRGWYDAGDYNKYVVNSGISTSTLLSLYEDFPAYMKTVKLNIPESGNGVPDLLNEVLWNLRWMLTMQDPNDGGVYHKLTNAVFDKFEMPDKDITPRYVVQKGTAAALDFAAVMAQASRIFKQFPQQTPGLADSCIVAAKSAWQWAVKNPNVAYRQDENNKKFNPAITTGGYGDNNFTDEFIWAASEMFVTTSDSDYLKNINLLPDDKMPVPAWGQVKLLGYYTLLKNNAGIAELPEIKKRLINAADGLIKGVDDNAYQTSMTLSARHFGWGSNSDAANQGVLLLQAYRLIPDKKYLDNALADLDYLLGRNATGYSYVTGYGTKTPMHPHHRPSASDGITEPIPGLLVGGPNPGMQDGIKVPSKVPDEAYIDDTQAYAANEVTINWNAPIAYLANAIEALQNQLSLKTKSTK
ncbi:glycoside hydrolase family 9 protein [Mucilaginibacter sp. KACC 22773]|uniref:glycoside hydrolase family 9 protein n=1 Tax=Mucilaginibacter sp. KACC 22773 TaxID=3025671 RepID=UPI002365DF81|nr:glycoside hydrolase family 9 protein [Mucilaginibacter sp. KACC 22773]WDF81033.1 glycoside hydrolase family 9 protein [Mucilaginibacter sp. KACC 22773]